MALVFIPRKEEPSEPPPRVPWRKAVHDFIYGLISYEFEVHARESRAEIETAFLLITMGDMLGVPIMPPLYALRLLPYAVPNIEGWKRRVSRERDIGDREEYHLHGI